LMKWKSSYAGGGTTYHRDEIHHLLRIVECIIFRIWLNKGEAREATLMMWGMGYKVARKVYWFGKTSPTSAELNDLLKEISNDFSDYKSNPDTLNGLKLQEWNWSSTKAGNYPLTSVMYALEETFDSPVRKGKGAASIWKITPLMPLVNSDYWITRHWDYGPEKSQNSQPRSRTIGNMFALKPSRKDINDIGWIVGPRVSQFRNFTMGQSVTNDDIQNSNDWDHDYIDSRNDRLISLLEKRFPHSCWLPNIDNVYQ